MPESRVAGRKQQLEAELERCLELLIDHGPPKKVILFGSMAQDDVNEWSDIDLIIVEETDLPFLKRIKKHRNLLKPRIGMDIAVYTYLIHTYPHIT